MDTKLKIYKGAICEGVKPVKLEFGNPEQIKLLKKQAKYVQDLKEGTVLPQTEIEITLRFDCACGYPLSVNESGFDLVQINQEFGGKEIQCQKCKRNYQLVYEEFDDVYVKLIE